MPEFDALPEVMPKPTKVSASPSAWSREDARGTGATPASLARRMSAMSLTMLSASYCGCCRPLATLMTFDGLSTSFPSANTAPETPPSRQWAAVITQRDAMTVPLHRPPSAVRSAPTAG
jgi:hypothetical protein